MAEVLTPKFPEWLEEYQRIPNALEDINPIFAQFIHSQVERVILPVYKRDRYSTPIIANARVLAQLHSSDISTYIKEGAVPFATWMMKLPGKGGIERLSRYYGENLSLGMISLKDWLDLPDTATEYIEGVLQSLDITESQRRVRGSADLIMLWLRQVNGTSLTEWLARSRWKYIVRQLYNYPIAYDTRSLHPPYRS